MESVLSASEIRPRLFAPLQVPFDGIGGNPGCPVWQVAYIVIARNLWKYHGDDALPALKQVDTCHSFPAFHRAFTVFLIPFQHLFAALGRAI